LISYKEEFFFSLEESNCILPNRKVCDLAHENNIIRVIFEEMFDMMLVLHWVALRAERAEEEPLAPKISI
jgi:hypothetical protein